MYLMIGKGQIAQKDNIGAKRESRTKNTGKCMSRGVYWMHAAMVPMQLQVINRFQNLTALHARLFRLLRVLPVWWSSLSDDLLSPDLLENLNSWVGSRSFWLYSILWIRTKSYINLFFKGLWVLLHMHIQSNREFLEKWNVNRIGNSN